MTDTKHIAKLMKVVDKRHFFWLNNGEFIASLEGLVDALEHMDDDLFLYHVNEQKNDFAEWIDHCLKDKELSSLLISTRERSHMIQVLKHEVSERESIEKKKKLMEVKFKDIETEILKKDHQLSNISENSRILEEKMAQMNSLIGNKEVIMRQKYALVKDLEKKIELEERSILERKDVFIKKIVEDERNRERQKVLEELLRKKDEKLLQKEDDLKQKDAEILAKYNQLNRDLIDHERKVMQLQAKEAELNDFIKEKERMIAEREMLMQEKDAQLDMERSEAHRKTGELNSREAELFRNEELLLETKANMEKKLLQINGKQESLKEEEEQLRRQREAWDREEKAIISRLRTLKDEITHEERRRDKIFFEIHNLEAREKAVAEKEKSLEIDRSRIEQEKEQIEEKKISLKTQRNIIKNKEQLMKEHELELEMQRKRMKEEEAILKGRMRDLDAKKALIAEEEQNLMKSIDEKERKLRNMESQIEMIRSEKLAHRERERELDSLKERALQEYKKFNEKIVSLSKKEKELDRREAHIFEREVHARKVLSDATDKARKLERSEKVKSLLSKFNIANKPADPLEGASKGEELIAIKEGEKNVIELARKVNRVKELLGSDKVKEASKEYQDIEKGVSDLKEKGKRLEHVISLIDDVIRQVKRQDLGEARKIYHHLKGEYDQLEDYEKHTLYDEVMELYNILKD